MSAARLLTALFACAVTEAGGRKNRGGGEVVFGEGVWGVEGSNSKEARR